MIERSALNTKDTLAFVEKHNVVTLRADWTHESKEIDQALEKFNSISIPLTVIFPSEAPDRPIILRDVYTKSTLLQSLKQATESGGDAARQANRNETVLK